MLNEKILNHMKLLQHLGRCEMAQFMDEHGRNQNQDEGDYGGQPVIAEEKIKHRAPLTFPKRARQENQLPVGAL